MIVNDVVRCCNNYVRNIGVYTGGGEPGEALQLRARRGVDAEAGGLEYMFSCIC